MSKVAGRTTELTFTLTKLTADHVVFVGENDTVRTTDTIRVTPAGEGSRLTYHADMELHGAAKLAAPLAKLGLQKLGNDVERQMTKVLNALTT